MLRVMSRESASAPDWKPTVVALHCSGSSGRQWDKLALALGDRFRMIAPDLIGSGATPHWTGDRNFHLADEAARIVEIVDALDGPVHLVGHSYGGGVALRIARERPHRIGSLSLYEPSAFHVLRSAGPDGRSALEDIRAIAGAVTADVAAGAYRAAARRFVDYWNGEGTWADIKLGVQGELIRYVLKTPLEFSALIEEQTPLVAYRRFAFPVLLVRGEHAPTPTALIVQKLFSTLRTATVEQVAGAGHMGPFSHAEAVSEMLAAHVAAAAGIDRQGLARLRAAA